MEELDERKTKILNVIIRTYLKTGEPVGSRTISKDKDLDLSSATIRNEMADLEELGYIEQPHTSSGRIPTDKGYRFYVDHLMVKQDQEITEMKDFVIERTEKLEEVLKNVAETLSKNTNYTTMISTPQGYSGKVKFIQLTMVDSEQLLVVIVLENNIVKNRILHLDEPLDNESLLKLNILLNSSLNGLTIDQINLGMISQLKEQAGIHSQIVSDILDEVAKAIREDKNLEVYTSGATNIFKYPELSDSEMAKNLISTFEDKKEIKEFLSESMDEQTGIQIYIGKESPVQQFKDCSVVTATYDLGDGMHGAIGIVGPKRMDYQNVMENLRNMRSQMVKTFGKSGSGGEGDSKEGGNEPASGADSGTGSNPGEASGAGPEPGENPGGGAGSEN